MKNVFLCQDLYFSAVEDDPKIVQKAKAEGVDVDPMQFSTLRFYHHADPKNQAINKYGSRYQLGEDSMEGDSSKFAQGASTTVEIVRLPIS